MSLNIDSLQLMWRLLLQDHHHWWGQAQAEFQQLWRRTVGGRAARAPRYERPAAGRTRWEGNVPFNATAPPLTAKTNAAIDHVFAPPTPLPPAQLASRLPPRVQIYPWSLAYSTGRNGTSLKTLYRSLVDVDGPVLLVVKDMDNQVDNRAPPPPFHLFTSFFIWTWFSSQVFGAFSTHPFRVSEHCYGTGETFLYSFCPEIKVWIKLVLELGCCSTDGNIIAPSFSPFDL